MCSQIRIKFYWIIFSTWCSFTKFGDIRSEFFQWKIYIYYRLVLFKYKILYHVLYSNKYYHTDGDLSVWRLRFLPLNDHGGGGDGTHVHSTWSAARHWSKEVIRNQARRLLEYEEVAKPTRHYAFIEKRMYRGSNWLKAVTRVPR